MGEVCPAMTPEAERRDAELARFETCADAYLDYLAGVRHVSPNTTRSYRQDIESFLGWAQREGVTPFFLTHRDVRGFLGELSRARYSPRTINRRLSALRGLYRWMVREGHCDSDVLAAVSSLKLPRTLPRSMSDSEADALLAACGGLDCVDVRDRAFLELLYATGARISEVSRLDVQDVDFAQGQVRLFGKGSKERIVPVYDAAMRCLTDYVSHARPQLLRPEGERQALFLSTRGNRMSADALRTRFEKRAVEAGLDASYTPHAMRHTFATELLAGGADLRSVQELLGHESLSTTQVYTHLSVGRLKEAAYRAHPRS